MLLGAIFERCVTAGGKKKRKSKTVDYAVRVSEPSINAAAAATAISLLVSAHKAHAKLYTLCTPQEEEEEVKVARRLQLSY